MSQQLGFTVPLKLNQQQNQQTNVLTLERTQKFRLKLQKMQNKVHFFEGQLNPLSIENKSLKQQIVELQKSVSTSADILRRLLPVQNNPSRKLKLYMASIQQICVMIKEDWDRLVGEVQELNITNGDQQIKIKDLEIAMKKLADQYDTELTNQKNQFTRIREILIQEIAALKLEIQETKQNCEKQKQQMELKHIEQIKEAQGRQEELKKDVDKAVEQISKKKKGIEKLKQQINLNLQEFERSKQNLKEIYDRQMEEKLYETQQSYEYMFNIKEEQNKQLIDQIYEKQEVFNGKISEKHSEVSYLNGIVDKCKEEIGKCKDEIWEKQLKLDQKYKNILQLEKGLQKEKDGLRQLQKKLDSTCIEHQQTISKLQKQHEEQTKIYKGSIANSYQQLQEKEAEKQKMMEQISQKDQQNAKIKQILRQKQQQFEKQIAVQKERADLLQNQISTSQQLFNHKLQDANHRIKLAQIQLEETIRKGQLGIKELQKKHDLDVKNMVHKFQSDHSEIMKKALEEYESKIYDIQIKNQQYIQELIIQQKSRLREQQGLINKLKTESSRLINELQSDLADKDQRLNKIQEDLSEAQQQKNQAERILISQKQRMDQKLQEQKNQFEKRLLQKQRQFEKKILEKQLQMKEQEEHLKNMIELIKNDMMNEIKTLKKSAGLQEVEQMYKKMISQLEEKNRRQLMDKDQEMAQKINEVEQARHQQIKRLNEEYNQELQQLSKKLEFDISRLNDELFDEKKAHQFSNMTKQEKIDYLLFQVHTIKGSMREKEEELIKLECMVDKKNRQLAKIDEIIQERIQQKQLEMQAQIDHLKQSNCRQIQEIEAKSRIRIQEIQTERIKHCQQLYLEFEEIKTKHQIETKRLHKKYHQLESLFEERPSRVEDLNKIKQLILQRAKLDQVIKESKRKAEHANQIVKYMQFQLQNYKDTYDIFGPHDQSNHEKPAKKHQESDNRKSPFDHFQKQLLSSFLNDSQHSEPLLRQKREKQRSRRYTQASVTTPIRLFPTLSKNKSVVPEDIDELDEQDTNRLIKKQQKKLNNDLRKGSGELNDKAQILINLNKKQKLGLVYEPKNEYKRKTNNRSLRKKRDESRNTKKSEEKV